MFFYIFVFLDEKVWHTNIHTHINKQTNIPTYKQAYKKNTNKFKKKGNWSNFLNMFMVKKNCPTDSK